MDRSLWLPTLSFLVLLSPTALAQPRGKPADVLFKEGRDAFDKGDYARACPKFAESQKIDPAPGTLLNLAVCEERTGKLVSARQHFTEVLSQLPARDERVSFVKELLAKVDARVGRLSLTLAPDAPKETEVKDEREGKPVPLGVELMLDPGEYSFEITAPGRPSDQLRLTLAEGQRDARAVAPLPAPVAVTVAPAKPGAGDPGMAGRNLRRTLGFAAGGVGVAAFGVAAVTGVVLLGKKGAVDAECPEKSPGMRVCSPAGFKLLADARSTPLLPLNTVSWILGIAGVGAGVALVLTSGSKGAGEPRATAFATALPGGGGLGVSGRF
jgi:hypothetical protein